MKKQYLDWKEIERLVDVLHESILQSGLQFDKIYGIPRGGLIPAVLLSHKMNIPLTNYMYSENTLIVDDICDTGKTMSEIYADNKTAVLHHKPHTSNYTPAFYSCIWGTDDWIVYPWELKDSKAIQDYKTTNT
jgi:hypothetical protein